MENKIAAKHKEHEKAMKDYLEFNEERQKNFDTLKKKDENSAKEIDDQMRRIQNFIVILKVFYDLFQFYAPSDKQKSKKKKGHF